MGNKQKSRNKLQIAQNINVQHAFGIMQKKSKIDANAPKFAEQMPAMPIFKIHIAIDFGTDGMGMSITT